MLVFSPIEKNTLYLGTQYVMKTTDGGLHWEKISPDLTGAAPNAASEKPAGPVTVQNAKERGFGVVASIAPSPLKAEEIWAGSDTGLSISRSMAARPGRTSRRRGSATGAESP